MLKLVLPALFLLSSCMPESKESKAGQDNNVMFACGESFHIRLLEGEILEQHSVQHEDFTLYFITERGQEDIEIYVGNRPQPGGIILKTDKDRPSVVAVHGPKSLADRITVSDEKPKDCQLAVLREG